MMEQLTGSHRSTYEAVFQHPVARNLDWQDVRSMLGALPNSVQQEHNGILKVTRNGHTLVLHRPMRKSHAEVQELMDIRRFLEKSDAPSPQPAAAGAHLLVVIDHREARVYKAELHGSIPQRITPYDPGGSGRHLHYVQDDSNGQRKPERRSFYQAVARTLEHAAKVLVFGSGTGSSSAMEQLLLELRHHHPDVAKHIVGSLVVNEQHLSDDQLLARAREFYAAEEMKK